MNTIDTAKLPQPILGGHPEWIELYYKAWELAARNIRRGKSGRLYMDDAWDPARNYQWVWDTCFMTFYCRYAADQYPGIESLDNFYDLQREDGYISMTYDMDSGEEPWPDRINPPLFAWAELDYYRATGDASRLERVAGHIERLMEWIDNNRRTAPHRRRTAIDSPYAGRGESVDNFQLYYFEDCGSSGMDDSPRTPREHAAGQFFDWIDLSSQMALSFRCLTEIQDALGNAARAAEWRTRAEEVGALVNAELWCDSTRFYHDRMRPLNFVAHKTAAGFWPMLAGICPPERVTNLVEHLLDEREFNRPTPVPSLSADDLNYSPQGVYWLGGVWAPTNYMVIRGLSHCGRRDIAHDIASRYLGVLQRTYANVEPHTLWESYCPEADRPGKAPYDNQDVKPNFVGWTGVGPIAVLIENIIGLTVDAPRARIDWDIRLTEEHGINRLPVGEGATVDLICKARSADDKARVRAVSGRRIELNVTRGDQSVTLQLSPGETVEADV